VALPQSGRFRSDGRPRRPRPRLGPSAGVAWWPASLARALTPARLGLRASRARG